MKQGDALVISHSSHLLQRQAQDGVHLFAAPERQC